MAKFVNADHSSTLSSQIYIEAEYVRKLMQYTQFFADQKTAEIANAFIIQQLSCS